MNKQTIITALLALVTLAGQAKKTIVWETPSVAYSAIPYFGIQKVEMTKEKTAMYVSMNLIPGYGFRISKDSYLQTNGKQYGIIGSDSIPLGGDYIVLDDTGRKDFILYFKPLPLDTKEFDFLEGLAKGDYKVFGIHDKDYTIPPASVPTEYMADDDGEGLAEMKFDATPATIHFNSLNYRKGMNTEIQVQYVDLKNPSKPMDVETNLNDDGEASISLPICLPQIVWINIVNIPWASMGCVYLSPGKDVTVLVDMLHDDSRANSKIVGAKGYYAKFGKEWYQSALEEETGNGPQKPTIKKEDIHDVQTLIRYCNEERENYDKWIKNSNYCKAIKDYLIQFAYSPLFMFEGEQDSLSKTKEFTDYVLQNYTKNLYKKNIVFNNEFPRASKYYAMADARGFNADLARYCYYLPQVLDSKKVEKPLIEDKNLSDLYDKYVAEYQKTVAANKEGLAANVHYLDMTEVAPETTLQIILDKHKGKTILVDLWATWCGPCKLGHEKMKPLKEELKDKDIVYIYIAAPSSNYDEWKTYIADIPGEHYFLTEDQYRYISEQYGCTGIPFYAIYNTKGNQTFKQEGFAGVEIIKEALEKVLGD
ncbi:MAG: TlpA family protein disulfide reductase [Prevotella sp.]|nr:TlpA family protein disulfide reductase [Prevotella sp.]